MEQYSVTFDELDSLLVSLPENTTETSYDICITEITKTQCDPTEDVSLNNVLIKNSDKYVKLSFSSIPEDFTNAERMFKNCKNLVEIDCSSFYGITKMKETFIGCASLEKVINLPDSVTDAQYCFSNCKSLKNISNIPSHLTWLFYTFINCESLDNIPLLPNTITNMQGAFIGCKNLKSIPNIPDGVTTLYETFSGCVLLEEIPQIPSSVTNMRSAFYRCSSLKSVSNLPSKIIEFDYAFYNCVSLEEFPSLCITDMKSGIQSFIGCTSLKSVVNIYGNPVGAVTMYNCFQDCSSLESVYISCEMSKIRLPNMFLNTPDTLSIKVPWGEYGNWLKLNTQYLGIKSMNQIKIRTGINQFTAELANRQIRYIKYDPNQNGIIFSEDEKTVYINGVYLFGITFMSAQFPASLVTADFTGVDFTDTQGMLTYIFFYCELLRMVKLPKMKIVNGRAFFAGCSSLSQIDMTQVSIPKGATITEMFSLDNITVYYDPKKWGIKPHTHFGNATKAKFIPVEEIENKVEVNNKQIGTFYHNNQQYDKMIKGNNAYYLDNYKYLFGENIDEIDTNSAWGEFTEDGFEAWIF